MMLKVGLTGGIGSGKSYISNIFNMLQVPVYESDQQAKRLMKEDGALRLGIVSLFGEQAYKGNDLDNSYIAGKVFKDKNLLEALNSLVHPAVNKDFDLWMETLDTKVNYVIREAAILFETGVYRQMDKNILVVADEALRIERVIKRDGVAASEVVDRMRNQMKDTEKIKLADFIIYNENDSMILQQIVDLHHDLINKQK